MKLHLKDIDRCKSMLGIVFGFGERCFASPLVTQGQKYTNLCPGCQDDGGAKIGSGIIGFGPTEIPASPGWSQLYLFWSWRHSNMI